MPLKIRRTIQADQDTYDIWAYISMDNQRAADKLLELTFRREAILCGGLHAVSMSRWETPLVVGLAVGSRRADGLLAAPGGCGALPSIGANVYAN